MDSGFKYLEIKNWDRYQVSDRKGRDIKLYIKDYCSKDIDDPEYGRLTVYQRYVWDACCRLRGRTGKPLRNDCVWLARAMGMLPKERHCLPQAIRVLVACGFLVASETDAFQELPQSNQEVGLSDSESEADALSDSESEPETESAGGQGGAKCASSQEAPPLSDGPATQGELDSFKGKRLGEWEKGILTRMVNTGAWDKGDVGTAVRLVLNTPEAYPDGITFPAFQELVEAAAMVVHQ
jgi:hypothetical protein